MPAFIDLTGHEPGAFGQWTVLRYDARGVLLRNRGAYFVCRCKCGREQSVRGQDLRTGESRQCRSCANAASAKGNRRAESTATTARREKAKILRAEGKTLKAIGAELGVSGQAVHQLLSR